MIFNIVYLVATLIIPFRETYRFLKNQSQKNDQHAALWSFYWAFYIIIFYLKSSLQFLHLYSSTYPRKTFEVVIMLFLLWLYHENYKGALYLKYLLKSNISRNQMLNAVISSLKEWNHTLPIFENEKDDKK